MHHSPHTYARALVAVLSALTFVALAIGAAVDRGTVDSRPELDATEPTVMPVPAPEPPEVEQ